jgi:phage-related protein
MAGLGVALAGATKAAMEDAAEQANLALIMGNVTGASKEQVAAQEDVIAAMSRASGTADSELRPAFERLLTGTKDIATANSALALAQDIAQGSGRDLATVSDALAKAYGGNFKALGQLSPEIKAMIKDGASLDDVMNVLGGTFGGATAAAAETAAGRMKILGNSIDETKESIGAALLPAVEAILPVVQKFADWAQDNPGAFLAIAGTIGAIATAIMAVNFAMALNPFSLIAAGIAALVVGLAIAYKKFEGFRNIVNSVINFIIGGFETLANTWIKAINALIRAYNAIPFVDNVSTIESISLGRIGAAQEAAEGGISGVRKMATGGIVTAPTLAIVGEKGPEAVIPLDRMKNNGGQNITVNITGGISTSADIGRAVVNAIKAMNRVDGPAQIQVA